MQKFADIAQIIEITHESLRLAILTPIIVFSFCTPRLTLPVICYNNGGDSSIEKNKKFAKL
jgi:hypothetical protein